MIPIITFDIREEDHSKTEKVLSHRPAVFTTASHKLHTVKKWTLRLLIRGKLGLKK